MRTPSLSLEGPEANKPQEKIFSSLFICILGGVRDRGVRFQSAVRSSSKPSLWCCCSFYLQWSGSAPSPRLTFLVTDGIKSPAEASREEASILLFFTLHVCAPACDCVFVYR